MQISILGFISVVLGATIGSGIQVLLPLVLKDFLPMEINITLSWKSFFEGIFMGSAITSLFSMIPILTIRRISPLMTLRSSVANERKLDFGQWFLGFVIAVTLFLFMYRITSSWRDAIVFTVGLGMGFLLLYGFAALIVFLLRIILSPSWPFVFRQGVSNLYRPQNQTKTLILSLGLGTTVLTTLYFIQGLLLSNVSMMDTGNQPNTILYGIETNQVQGVIDSTKNLNLPIIQNVPIVTMKLEAWNGKSKAEWLKDTISSRGNRWAMNREARVTYRDTLADKETLISGVINRAVKEDGDSVFVSLADSYAEALNLKLGDEIVFNVQGTLITCYVGSIRRIEFNNMSTRFFIVFPSGVLEQAPQFSVLVTKTPNADITAQYRNIIVKSFPNVSVVDLASILTAVSDILNKVSYVIKFMALFSLITGFIVLISSLMLSKFQRIGESVLLRTIGARKKIILWINVIEYFVLGFLASISGVILSMIAAFLIANYQFQLDFHVNFWPILLIVFFITTITVVIGILNSKEVLNNPPLEVLRKEV
jgi:putative ABC transport system permease protein